MRLFRNFCKILVKFSVLGACIPSVH